MAIYLLGTTGGGGGSVTSVNGQIGVVTLDTDDIAEGISNLYFTAERAQDAVGSALTDTDTVDLTYTDASDTITADVRIQKSITSDVNGIELDGDSAAPGNSKYYGTDGAGAKGFHTLPVTAALADPGSNGIVVRTALNTTVARTLAEGTAITITDPDGVAGDPTINFDETANLTLSGTVAFSTAYPTGPGGTPPTSGSLADKAYVDAIASGVLPSSSVLVATTSALPACTIDGTFKILTASANGALPAQDGVTLIAGDSFLVKDQVTTANNGKYTVTDAGSAGTPWILTRLTNFDSAAEIIQGTASPVISGTTNGNSIWWLISSTVVTLGTDPIVFDFLAYGVSPTASNGVIKVVNDFQADLATNEGLALTANQLKVDYDNSTIGITGGKLALLNVPAAAIGFDTDDVPEGATNKYFTDERAQDAVGAMIADTQTVNLTYTDATPELKADVITQMSITADASGVKLSGDASTPGNTKYYGTDGSGTKGFYDIPTATQNLNDVLTIGNDAGAHQIKNALDGTDPQDLVTLAQLTASVGSVVSVTGSWVDNTDPVNPVVGTPFSNWTATVVPTVTDDDTAGYIIGSTWINTTTGQLFTATDVTTGAAVWKGAPVPTPVAIAKSAVATATDLIDGQLYEVTGFTAFTSTLTINRGYFLGKYNLQSGVVEMSAWGHVQISSGDGSTYDSSCTMDWYDTGNPIIVHEPYYNNYVEGFANIDIFPFQSGVDGSGNKVGAGFTLDLTALTTEKFKNNTCYGNGTFTATTGRDYEGIDFTKGYFLTYGNITQSGTGIDPTIDVFKNETGGTLTTGYDAAGQYRLTCSIASFGATASDAWLHVGNPPFALSASTSIAWATDSRVDFSCGQFGTGQDDIFLDTPFEIRVLIS